MAAVIETEDLRLGTSETPGTGESCYACERPGSTVEHCPPKSFFPQGQRVQLLTVRSCPTHNNENSKDVEYVRNVLSTMWGVNTTGEQLFRGKVKRSLDRSPALLKKTFGDLETVLYQGQITGALTIDTSRVERVFESCARAIHYLETRKKQRNWAIVTPQLGFRPDAPREATVGWGRVYEMLRSLAFGKKKVANPQVFEYGVSQLEGHHFYCFLMYQSFLVYALPLPEDFFLSVRLSKESK